MSRPSTSTLAMALAGSEATNAVPAPAALASGGMPLPLHNSFSTTTTTANHNRKTLSMDIPKSRHSYGKPLATKATAGNLPTPPNSVSPTLYPLSQERETYHKAGPAIAAANVVSNPTPAQDSQSRQNGKASGLGIATGKGIANGDKAKASLGSASQRDIDSDLDLREAVEHANAQSQPPYRHRHLLHRRQDSQHSQLQQSHSEITPASLAAYHIPEILLKEGPLAIRHIVERLSQRIPGFSRIPPAKARRLVAAALEETEREKFGKHQERGSMFAKVNSSGLDAGTALKGTATIGRASMDNQSQSEDSACGSLESSPIAKNRARHLRSSSMTTMAESPSTAFSYSGTPVMGCLRDRCNTAMNDADKMSSAYGYDDIVMDDVDDEGEKHGRGSIGDGDDDEDLDMDWNEADDMTDEEDWAQIGADALLARSYGMSPPTHMMASTSGPTSRTMGMAITGRSGIVPLQAQQAIAQCQSTSDSFVNARRRVNQHEGLPVAGRVNHGGQSYDSGYSGSSFGASALAKSMPAMAVAKGPSPLSTMKLGPEQRDQLAGSDPEERAAIEALLRLGSTPI